MVLEEGIEPTRPCGHRILSPARLPVPPLELKRLWQVSTPPRLRSSHRGAEKRQSQRFGPLLRSRRNSRSSTGAPLSRIIATVTPSEGEFGGVRISFPSIAA